MRRADGGSPGRIDGDRACRGSGSPDGDELLAVKAGTMDRVGAEGRVGGASHFPPFRRSLSPKGQAVLSVSSRHFPLPPESCRSPWVRSRTLI